MTPTNEPIFWLLTIEWAGAVIRLSSDELSVQTSAGSYLAYEAGLDEIEVEEGIDLFADSAGQLSVSVEFLSPVSIAQLVAQGNDLSSARAELARWVRGTKFEDRRVVLVGRLVDPEFGADEEPVSCSVEEALVNDYALLPGPGAVVSLATWERADTIGDSGLGLAYPVIIGRPGRVGNDVSTRGWVTGSVAVWASHYADNVAAVGGLRPQMITEVIVVLAGHHVSAERVYLNNDTYTPGHRFKVFNGFDQLGQPVAYVPFYIYTDAANPYIFNNTANYDTFTSVDPDVASGGALYSLGYISLDNSFTFNSEGFQGPGDSAPLYVGWYDETPTDGGGLLVDGALIREAGAVIEWLLSQTSIQVDRGRMAAVKPKLARFLLDGCITARTSPWELLKEEILPLLPVSVCSGPEGLYLVYWDYEAAPGDAVALLDADADPTIDRLERVKYDTEDRANRISVSYAYSYRTKTYLSTLTLGAEADTKEDPEVHVHPLCEFSRLRTGERIDRSLESPWIYDTSTAWAVAEWQAAAYSLPSRTVEYAVPEGVYCFLERGAVVLLSDSELYLSQQVCLVQNVVTDGSGTLRLTLSIIDNRINNAEA